jgi:hypothetical protein
MAHDEYSADIRASQSVDVSNCQWDFARRLPIPPRQCIIQLQGRGLALASIAWHLIFGKEVLVVDVKLIQKPPKSAFIRLTATVLAISTQGLSSFSLPFESSTTGTRNQTAQTCPLRLRLI